MDGETAKSVKDENPARSLRERMPRAVGWALAAAACALLAGGSDIDETTLPALAWLEQTRPGVFERHTLEKGAPRHASLDVGDFDHDGDVDIAVGTFMLVPGSPPSTNWVEIWENQRAH